MRIVRRAMVPLCVALCAALFAHVAIDILGDWLLAHDTYDDVAHGSRGVAACGVLALTFLIGAGALRALVRSARGSEHAFCAALGAALPRSPLAFAGVVVTAAFAALAAMEALDATLAGGAIDDLADLFGGSLMLGGSVTACIALALAGAAWAAFRRLARARLTLVRAVARVLRRLAPHAGIIVLGRRPPRRAHGASRTCAVRSAGRAPPLLVFG